MTPWKKGVTTARNRRMEANRGKPSEFRIVDLNGQGLLIFTSSARHKNFTEISSTLIHIKRETLIFYKITL